MSAIARVPAPSRVAAVENYFNYFTQIEECFQRSRKTPTLLSPLDWALIESWKEAGIPLEAVLVGIQRAFQKFAKRPQRFRKINGLAYCSQLVLEAAEQMSTAKAEGGAKQENQRELAAPFTPEEIQSFLNRSAGALEKARDRCRENSQQILAADLNEAAAALREIISRGSGDVLSDLEELERFLSALEEKLTASLTRASPVELLTQVRREVDRGIIPYRRKMSGAQLEPLERQFTKKRLLEHYRIPRLSLFFL